MLLHYLVKFENPKKYCGFVAQQAVQQIHNKTEQMELEHKVIEQCAVWLKLHCIYILYFLLCVFLFYCVIVTAF